MKKIPTVFVRDPDDRKHVTQEWHPDCLWVRDGEGAALRKYDGTCVMFDGALWWARRIVKEGGRTPPGFLLSEEDEWTGSLVGWEPAEQSGYWKTLREALGGVHATWPLPVGTYELCGPKINGNPEGFVDHTLIRHADAQQLTLPPQRDFETLRRICIDLLRINHVEGIVFHRNPGDAGTQMSKIKCTDFPRVATVE